MGRTEHLKLNTKVYDRWWPYRHGVIVKVLKTRRYVKWSNGEIWNYDLAHTQFLEKVPRRIVGKT